MQLSVFSLLFVAIVLCHANSENQFGTVIGIDLGTTYSCVGVMKSGIVEIIANEQGNRITPSYVAFTAEGSRLIGDSAKNQLTTNHKNTVFDVKRFIGRPWNDEILQKDLKHFPFDVVDRDNRPFVKVTVKDEDKYFAPEEISAMVLTKMKDIAENYLGTKVTHAVVTVPAYFNDAQRQATKTAGKIAGLNILRIINEPTAAAIAYGLDKKVKDGNGKSKEKQILVFDLGGGTFDVSLLAIDEEVFEVVSTSGDTHLGGEDFDQNVIDYFIQVIEKKKGKDISKNQRAIQKLRREVEKAKRSLSSVLSTRIEIESLYDGEDFSETLTRAKFEELNNELFMSTLKPVQKVIEDGKIKKEDIDEIVLVGGSTRIPKIQKIVKDFFNKEPHTGINPDEAIAYGAAIQGSVLSGDKATSDLLLLDVCPLTLGMELESGFMAKLIPRNTPIPTVKKDVFTTVVDNQESVVTAIYEGERPLVKDNHFLGKFTLTGIPPAPRGMPQIEVTFEIDANGILKVTAESKESGSKQHIVIQNNKDRLSEEEIERMIKESEKFKDQDTQLDERNKAKSSLEQFLYTTKSHLNSKSFTNGASDEDVKRFSSYLETVIAWLDKAAIDNTEKSEYVNRQKDLEADLEQLMKGKKGKDEL